MSAHEAAHVNVGTIGHIDHGKTTLTAAITKVAAEQGTNTEERDFDSIDNAPRSASAASRSTRPTSSTRRRTATTRVDCPGHADYIKNMITGAARVGRCDPRGLRRRRAHAADAEHILLARQVEVPSIVVALNKADMVDDPELLEARRDGGRELLTKYEFPGDDIPVVAVSALKALKGDAEWTRILELMEAVDSYIQASATSTSRSSCRSRT